LYLVARKKEIKWKMPPIETKLNPRHQALNSCSPKPNQQNRPNH